MVERERALVLATHEALAVLKTESKAKSRHDWVLNSAIIRPKGRLKSLVTPRFTRNEPTWEILISLHLILYGTFLGSGKGNPFLYGKC